MKKYLISFLSCPLHSHNSSFAIFSIWFTLLLLFFNLFCTRLWSLQKIFKAQLDIFKSCFDQFRIQIITLSPSLFFTYNLYRLFSEEICVLSWSTSNSYIDLNWSLSFQIIILCTSQSIQSNCYFLVYILGFSYCFNIFLIFLIFHPLCYIHVIIRRRYKRCWAFNTLIALFITYLLSCLYFCVSLFQIILWCYRCF